MTKSHKYYMQGFGIQTKNINDLIAKIEKEIDYVTKNMDRNVIVLNNKLTYCSVELERLKKELAKLKEYALEEYNKLEIKVSGLESQLNFLKANINVITTKSLDGNTYAVGIAPSSVYEQTGKTYPIWANRAEKDVSGNDIHTTYAKQTQVNTIQNNLNVLSSTVIELKNDAVKFKGEIAYTAVSSLNPIVNDVYKITGVDGWKKPVQNTAGYLAILVGNNDNIRFNGNCWELFVDNSQTSAIPESFINNLDWGV